MTSKCDATSHLFQGSVLYLQAEGIFDQSGSMVMSKEDILAALKAVASEIAQPERMGSLTLPPSKSEVQLLAEATPSAEQRPDEIDGMLKDVEDAIFGATGSALLSGEKHGAADKSIIYRSLCVAGNTVAGVRDMLRNAAPSSARFSENKRKGNKPIEQLMAEYTAENCDFTDMEWVKLAAMRYVQTMEDCQVRCLLYALARAESAIAQPSEAKIAGAVARGWCSAGNAHKTMDPDLAQAITLQVMALLRATDSVAPK